MKDLRYEFWSVRGGIRKCFSYINNNIYVVVFVLFVSGLCGQQLSDQSQISLLTCSPGQEIYTIFGHSAVRVFDPALRMDSVYNYGTFDFKKPGFAIKFMRGKLDYELRVTTYENFLREYHYFERDVVEQIFDLSRADRQKIFDFLHNNSLPENRGYQYDFFFDNCSTRIRDLLEKELKGVNYEAINPKEVTLRQQLDEYLGGMPWTDFGIDLIIGARADQSSDLRKQMFLPDYLHDHLARTTYLSEDNKTELIASEYDVLSFDGKEVESFWLTPVVLLTFLVFLELVFLFWINNGLFLAIYDRLWFVLMALASCMIAFMWFATDHQACGNNWNLLWLSPLYVPYLLFKDEKIRKYIAIGLLVCLGLALLGWMWIPQQYHVAFIPIILISGLKLGRAMGLDILQAWKTSH